MKTINKLFVPILISLIMTTASAFSTFRNGKVIMIVSVQVKNYKEWKTGFDAGAGVREKAGIKVLSVCLSTEDENRVVVIEEAENAQSAHDFLTLLQSKQKEGDIAKLDIKLYDAAE